MKKIVKIIAFALLISCANESKENIREEKKTEMQENIENKAVKKSQKYLNYSEFKKQYSYFDYFLSTDSFYGDIDELKVYISEKEKDLKKLNFSYEDGNFFKEVLNPLSEKERVIQVIKLLIETQENEVLKFSNNYLKSEFLGMLRNEDGVMKGIEEDEQDKYILNILEENFSEKEIRVFFDLYYLNYELGGYDISGKYGLAKVDKIISEVEKEEPISEKERTERENNGNVNKFGSNVVENINSSIFILENNKIYLIGKEDKVVKEITVQNYEKAAVIFYKDVLYVLDENKIFEYSGEKFENIKASEIK